MEGSYVHDENFNTCAKEAFEISQSNVSILTKSNRTIAEIDDEIETKISITQRLLNALRSIDLTKYSSPNEDKPKTDYTYAKCYVSNNINQNVVMPNLCRRGRRSPQHDETKTVIVKEQKTKSPNKLERNLNADLMDDNVKKARNIPKPKKPKQHSLSGACFTIVWFAMLLMIPVGFYTLNTIDKENSLVSTLWHSETTQYWIKRGEEYKEMSTNYTNVILNDVSDKIGVTMEATFSYLHQLKNETLLNSYKQKIGSTLSNTYSYLEQVKCDLMSSDYEQKMLSLKSSMSDFWNKIVTLDRKFKFSF